MGRPRIVVVGAGFAGYECVHTLSRISAGRADITILNATDYFLYLPLLPEVAAGILEPRRISVPLVGRLPGVRLVVGQATSVDLAERRVSYEDPEGEAGGLGYDRLVLAVGGVNKLLPVPGATQHAHGFRGLPEALYLRDHVTGQLEAAATTADERERAARCTFVVVGAGYTGTEVAAHGVLFTEALARQSSGLDAQQPRWLLLDVADRVLPGLHPRMSAEAERVLRERGVELCTGTSVEEATGDGVRLSDGRFVPTRSLIWCVGVRPDPLVADLGLDTADGRLVVDKYLTVPGHPRVYACGDAAAVPDLTRGGALTAMTAQHAVRQGRAVARNIAAAYGTGRRRAYRHRDLGFVVDLGGRDAAANVGKVPLTGLVAKTATRGYHLFAMRGNRPRVAADWLLDTMLPRQSVHLGLVPAKAVPLDSAAPELPAAVRREEQRDGRSSVTGGAAKPA